MKLIIRDEKSKEDTCEIWVEKTSEGKIRVYSQIRGGLELLEVVILPDMTIFRTANGNFKWNKE